MKNKTIQEGIISKLDQIAEALLKKRSLTGDEFEELFQQKLSNFKGKIKDSLSK